jgi:hypothetical protein
MDLGTVLYVLEAGCDSECNEQNQRRDHERDVVHRSSQLLTGLDKVAVNGSPRSAEQANDDAIRR